MIPSWAIIVIGGLSVVLLLMLLWICLEINSRSVRKKNLQKFEEIIYTQEKERAQKTLDTLQQANIAAAQPRSIIVPCAYQCTSTSTGHPVQQISNGYTMNCDQATMDIATPRIDTYSRGPMPYLPRPIERIDNFRTNAELADARCVNTENKGLVVMGVAPVQNSSYSSPQLRLAQGVHEIPSTPPPAPPVGYVTVPVVAEQSH